jgi:hypothetical protein
MKRKRKESPQARLERHAKRVLKPPYVRDGKFTTPQERYEWGDGRVILTELFNHLTGPGPRASIDDGSEVISVDLPKWLWTALFEAIASSPDIDSWDDVFHPPNRTADGRPARGKSRLALREREKLSLEIYMRVQKLTGQGENVDRGLFEDIAKDLKISRPKAEKIYYDSYIWIEAWIKIWASLE